MKTRLVVFFCCISTFSLAQDLLLEEPSLPPPETDCAIRLKTNLNSFPLGIFYRSSNLELEWEVLRNLTWRTGVEAIWNSSQGRSRGQLEAPGYGGYTGFAFIRPRAEKPHRKWLTHTATYWGMFYQLRQLDYQRTQHICHIGWTEPAESGWLTPAYECISSEYHPYSVQTIHRRTGFWCGIRHYLGRRCTLDLETRFGASGRSYTYFDYQENAGIPYPSGNDPYNRYRDASGSLFFELHLALGWNVRKLQD